MMSSRGIVIKFMSDDVNGLNLRIEISGFKEALNNLKIDVDLVGTIPVETEIKSPVDEIERLYNDLP
ncbi:hypothetical protein [Rufibacter quisquiliarum]|uniref:Uncharacterized protein n=1 Tax=Rufibacter quisquiliarum TaxID=1549639 RepID=A0A839GKA0_9BACT|nr:hypothetical protein [Rufibacter quisquiliarum]MBA9078193.1 hypothetical protein [Rufibacter quisquiliarum]